SMCSLLLALLLATQPDDDDLIREYNRREQIVSDVLARHRDHVRTRLRALYKLGRGGYARLLAESRSRADFFIRRAAASRILTRDLAELREYARERAALEAERERLAAAEHAQLAGLETLPLRPPVARLQIVEHFG